MRRHPLDNRAIGSSSSSDNQMHYSTIAAIVSPIAGGIICASYANGIIETAKRPGKPTTDEIFAYVSTNVSDLDKWTVRTLFSVPIGTLFFRAIGKWTSFPWRFSPLVFGACVIAATIIQPFKGIARVAAPIQDYMETRIDDEASQKRKTE